MVAVATIVHVTGAPLSAEKVTVAPITNELALMVGVVSLVLLSVLEVPLSELATKSTEVGVATVIPEVTMERFVNLVLCRNHHSLKVRYRRLL